MVEYIILEPRGYPHPLTARERALLPPRVWLTQWDQRDGIPFIAEDCGLSQRIFYAHTETIIITADDPADIARIIALDGVDPHIPLDHGNQKESPTMNHDSILTDLIIASSENQPPATPGEWATNQEITAHEEENWLITMNQPPATTPSEAPAGENSQKESVSSPLEPRVISGKTDLAAAIAARIRTPGQQ